MQCAGMADGDDLAIVVLHRSARSVGQDAIVRNCQRRASRILVQHAAADALEHLNVHTAVLTLRLLGGGGNGLFLDMSRDGAVMRDED
jgi:hypothetical protein